MKYVIIGGFHNDLEAIERFSSQLNNHIRPDKIVCYTLQEAIESKNALKKDAKDAFVITHSSGLLAVLQAKVNPKIMLINNPPAKTSHSRLMLRLIHKLRHQNGKSAKKNASLSLTELFFQRNVASFDLRNVSLPKDTRLILSEFDELFDLSIYLDLYQNTTMLPLDHGAIFSSPSEYIRLVKASNPKIFNANSLVGVGATAFQPGNVSHYLNARWD